MNRRMIAAGSWAAWATIVVTAFAGSRQVLTEPQRLEYAETHMGARVRILLYTTQPQVAKRAVEAAFARIAELDKIFSDYDNGSELMRLVERFAEGPADPVEVSHELYDILTRAESISRSTGGAFDVTAAPLIRQWRRAFREKKMPSAENLAKARERVGFERIRRIEPGRKISLEPGTRIDLGGIAKGYAAAAALQVLRQKGIDRALVAVAGDIAVGSAPPGQSGWAVEVAGLNPNTDAPLARLRLCDATISTSGDAERFVEIEGRRYSHIVDPRTGLGLTRRATVTVINQDGSASDAYATSLYLLGADGPELTSRIRNAPPLAVSWLEMSDTGHAEHRTNLAFDALPRE